MPPSSRPAQSIEVPMGSPQAATSPLSAQLGNFGGVHIDRESPVINAAMIPHWPWNYLGNDEFFNGVIYVYAGTRGEYSFDSCCKMLSAHIILLLVHDGSPPVGMRWWVFAFIGVAAGLSYPGTRIKRRTRWGKWSRSLFFFAVFIQVYVKPYAIYCIPTSDKSEHMKQFFIWTLLVIQLSCKSEVAQFVAQETKLYCGATCNTSVGVVRIPAAQCAHRPMPWMYPLWSRYARWNPACSRGTAPFQRLATVRRRMWDSWKVTHVGRSSPLYLQRRGFHPRFALQYNIR